MTLNKDGDVLEQKGAWSTLSTRNLSTFARAAFGVAFGALIAGSVPVVASAYSIATFKQKAPEFIEEIDAEYGEMVNIASLLHDYDESIILAVIVVESEGNKDAVSHKGAQGLMQLMPATAKSLGVKDPKEPFQNILAGTKYLKELERRWGFTTEEALVAYNMGPSAARRWLTRNDPDSYIYVQKVMYAYRVIEEKRAIEEAGTLALEEDDTKETSAPRFVLTRPRSVSLAAFPLSLASGRRGELETE